MINMSTANIYIHIPFCEKKCNYCDFTSFPLNNKELYEKYSQLIGKELTLKRDSFIWNKIQNIYFGGGTPSLFKASLIENILNSIKEQYEIIENSEITLEVNPGTVTFNDLKAYKDIGINRISLGIQSLNDNYLNFLGRIHNSQEALISIENSLKLFDNVTVDLIWGLPEQRTENIEDDLNILTSFPIKHISTYNLTLEKSVPLYNDMIKGKFKLPTDIYQEKIYFFIHDYLSAKDFIHYEISNFGKKNYLSNHNQDYWKRKPYLGLGVSAHGYDSNSESRTINDSNLNNYINNIENNNLPIINIEHLNKEDIITEEIWLPLRTSRGLKRERLLNYFSKEKIENFEKDFTAIYSDNLLEITDNNWKIPYKNWYKMESVIIKIIEMLL